MDLEDLEMIIDRKYHEDRENGHDVDGLYLIAATLVIIGKELRALREMEEEKRTSRNAGK